MQTSYFEFCCNFWASGGIVNYVILFGSIWIFYLILKNHDTKEFISILINNFPNVGLLGTVIGMIATFNSIANGDMKNMTSGISQALMTTLTALFVAIVATLLLSFCKRQKM